MPLLCVTKAAILPQQHKRFIMNTYNVKRTYPIAGQVKYMGAVMEDGQNTTIYYKDGYSPDFGFPLVAPANKNGTAVIGDCCQYKTGYKVTDTEKEVINNILNSEYMDATGERVVNWPVWSFSVTNETKRLAGALGSLVKKGYVFAEISEGDETCGLTKQGYELAVRLGYLK